VAFPGESEEDFAETIDVMKQVKFDQIFSFKYSPRPETEAQHYENIVDPVVASERLSYLQAFYTQLLDEKSQKQLGKVYEVYFEDLNADGYVSGRTDNNLVIKVKGSEELLGEFRNVKITQIARTIYTGELIG
jgi:tRNA-2-methylthio-N6-dimethylallyladenosine synthase